MREKFDAIKPYWLEALLYCVALGNAEAWHQYMLGTGSNDTAQLTISIYATELVIVSAGMWGITGLFIATAMFAATLVAIESVYGSHWIGHSYLALTIYLGTIGNYVRRKITQHENNKALGITRKDQETSKIKVDENGQISTKSLAQLSVARIRAQFNTSHNGARKLQKLAREGKPINLDLIRSFQK